MASLARNPFVLALNCDAFVCLECKSLHQLRPYLNCNMCNFLWLLQLCFLFCYSFFHTLFFNIAHSICSKTSSDDITQALNGFWIEQVFLCFVFIEARFHCTHSFEWCCCHRIYWHTRWMDDIFLVECNFCCTYAYHFMITKWKVV